MFIVNFKLSPTLTEPNVLKRRLKKNALPSKNIPLRSLEVTPTPEKAMNEKRRQERAVKRRNIISRQPPSSASHDEESIGEMEVELEISSQSIEMEAAEGLLELGRERHVDRACQTDLFSLPSHKRNFSEVLRSDKDVSTLTGLASMDMLKSIIQGVELVATCNGINLQGTPYDIEDKLILCLTKLKQNMSFSALAVLFGVSVPTAVAHFHCALHLLHHTLKRYVRWLPREKIRSNLPKCFSSFPNTRVVVDCSETSVSAPSCLSCRIQTYSHYKGRHTVKYMVGISPDGVISKVSGVYGGKASDKLIFLDSGVAGLCEPGDAVMADKGFFVDKECHEMGLSVIKPPYLRKKQLTKEEGDLNSSIARARVHVERAIQRMKVFKILQGNLPWNMVGCIDKITEVICAIVNLSNPIIGRNGFETT
ncbi:uncharacterized protein LOC124154677 [Ischnura elegans]|uniref:uncharacterized protein LOC124154677 n=1 Tax=Ischnura elegans TaxID=197161 RepID=UPI001ED87E6F|nr:uncharacterized protein LOC124154677 [Ischnura elegans]